MQSDTLIGIVGAAVLVAVMIGVFAYEYNNAPTDGVDGEQPQDQQERMEQFNETFPTLAAMQDIDGDGTPNWQDDDVDGDGTANTQDELTEVVVPLSASAPAHTNPAGTGAADATQFTVGQGNSHIEITISYDTGALGVNRLGADVDGPDDVPSATDTGGTGDLEIVQAAAVVDGAYTLNVQQTQVNPQALSYSGEIRITY